MFTTHTNAGKTYSNSDIIAIKSTLFTQTTTDNLCKLLADKKEAEDPIYQQLLSIFTYQLTVKAGLADITAADITALVAKKAHHLTRHFLKRKLGLIKPLAEFTYNEILIDPHHHLNSIYITNNEDLLALLPDFDAIYRDLRCRVKPDNMEEHFIEKTPGIVTDVQFFANGPRSNIGNSQFLQTQGYLTGGAFNHIDGTTCSADYCGPECVCNQDDLKNYLKDVILKKVQFIRIHMGETVIPDIGKKNIVALLTVLQNHKAALTGKTIRIGHGTHMAIEDMQHCAREGYYVEACLSSNKETGIIEKRKDYPLALLLLLGVKVMIGTDGGDLYYTDLKKEYAHADKSLKSYLAKIKARDTTLIKLANGDQLLFKHIKQLIPNPNVFPSIVDETALSFADLDRMIPAATLEEKISLQALLSNMQSFQALRAPHIKPRAEPRAEPRATPRPRPRPRPTQPINNQETTEEIFNKAIKIVTPPPSDSSPLSEAKRKLAAALRELQNKSKDLPPLAATTLAKEAQKLATALMNNPTQPAPIESFVTNTQQFNSNWSWKIVLGAVIGAAIGFIVGAMVGMGAGPGAALIAVAAAIKGAMIGGALAGTVGGLIGSGLGFWHHQKTQPLAQTIQAAKEVHNSGKGLAV